MIIVVALIAQPENIRAVEGQTTEGSEISAQDELKVTVGNGITMAPEPGSSQAVLAVSRTGAVAAFYQHGSAYSYRASPDRGVTWGPEMPAPPLWTGSACSVALRDGGVLQQFCSGSFAKGEAESHVSPMEGEFKDGWFTLHSTMGWFNDDFTSYEVGPVQVYMPDAVSTKQTQFAVSSWPLFDKGKILQLANGDLLAPMYGLFKGDTKSRVVLSVSSDRGHKWRYYATVASGATDPNPELPGQYNGPCEPSIALLPNGQMICVMRMQGSHHPPFKPLYASWSKDLGKTWTKPKPTQPHLKNVWPTLAVLDNGVVACIYGRPGVHVVFSIDNGHTWTNRVTFTNLPGWPTLPPQTMTGFVCHYADLVKVGPNKLLAIAAVGQGVGCPENRGTKVFPITVERVKKGSLVLPGRVYHRLGYSVPINGQ